jgi:hypothetical protein
MHAGVWPERFGRDHDTVRVFGPGRSEVASQLPLRRVGTYPQRQACLPLPGPVLAALGPRSGFERKLLGARRDPRYHGQR